MHAAAGGALIESLLDRIAGLHPAGIYAVVGALAALENIVPPIPADTAIALGAFIAARRPDVSVAVVYLVTLVANAGSAVGVFLAARRFGRPFFATRLGRRLLSERGLRRLDRVYRRYHLVGIFVSRFLPGYRAVVPPFAGIAGLRASQALPPVIVASALYYLLLVLLAHQVGSNWERVRQLLGGLSATLAAAAVLATVLVAAALWRHRRRRVTGG